MEQEDQKELLTDEEISALLPVQDEGANERDKKRRIVPYNFRRPDRLSKEHVRSLYLLHDLFAHSLSSSLPLFLRTFSEVGLISVEQQSYSDYLRGLPDPTNMFVVSADSLHGKFAIEMNSSVAFPVIDRMLGGSGQELSEKRPTTELELKVLEGLVTTIIDSYREVWKPIIKFETEIIGRETRPQLLQVVPPNEVVVAVVCQLQIGDACGLMSICLPVVMLEAVIEKFNQSAYAPKATTPPESVRAMLKTLSIVRFPVSAELEKSPVTITDVMNLAVGDVLRTNHRIENPVELKIGGETKFVGKLGAVEGRIILRIEENKEQNSAQAAA